MLDGTSDRGFPLVRLRAIDLDGAIGIRNLQNGAEGTLLARKVDNLVAPPSGRDFGSEEVLLALAFLETAGDVIGERTARLLDMCKARLERLIRTNRLAVHIDFEDTEAGRHPDS